MKPTFSLMDKRAIVTGAAKGLGKSIATTLAELGVTLSLVDIDEKGLAGTSAEIAGIGLPVHRICADITDLVDIRKIVSKTQAKIGGIDILVNNAGVAYPNPANEVTEDEWDKTLSVNLKGLFFLSQAVSESMIKNKYGKIVNIASQTGIVGLENYLTYAASKAGVIAITKVMAIEWGKYNININAIAPTVVMTPLGKKVWADKEKREKMLEKIPISRFAEPEDVANAVAFLSSDNSKMITGTTIMLDGGFTAQ